MIVETLLVAAGAVSGAGGLWYFTNKLAPKLKKKAANKRRSETAKQTAAAKKAAAIKPPSE